MDTQKNHDWHSPAPLHIPRSNFHAPRTPDVRERSKKRAFQVLNNTESRPLYRKAFPLDTSIDKLSEEAAQPWVDTFDFDTTIIRRKELFGEKIEDVTFLKVPTRLKMQELAKRHISDPHSPPNWADQIVVPTEWTVAHFTKWSHQVHIALESVDLGSAHKRHVTVTLQEQPSGKLESEHPYVLQRGQVLSGTSVSPKGEVSTTAFSIIGMSWESRRLMERQAPKSQQKSILSTIQGFFG